MKIAMFGHKRIPSREGGVEIVVEELAKREAALGNEITVYNRLGHHVSGSKFDSQIKSDDLKNIKIKTVFTFIGNKSKFFKLRCSTYSCRRPGVYVFFAKAIWQKSYSHNSRA